MTGKVIATIELPNGSKFEMACSEGALDAVRWNFNPSANPHVTLLKALSAALITQCEELRAGPGQRSRWASIAITDIESAQMFAVKAATYDELDRPKLEPKETKS